MIRTTYARRSRTTSRSTPTQRSQVSWSQAGDAAARRGGREGARAPAAGVAVFGPVSTVEATQINGHPALVTRIDGEIDMVVAVRIDDGLVTGLHTVRNPEKLTRVERETAVSR
ncbi:MULTISPECIES: hypothetical protein [unclassified Streptomyces]|uniref:hypothetical protein n=1 Tax=unclassified Streptomyces TaxID=2593676 RepID=UPI00365CA5C4